MNEILVKSILNKHKKRDLWFLTDYSLNPYQGCSFNCLYCYIRGSKYGVEMKVSVKKNAVELLDKQLSLRAKKKEYGFIGLASATDPYLPVERETQLTRRCLEVIAKHRFSVALLTRSPLVLRDVDLLHEIDEMAILPDDLAKKFHHGVIIGSSFTSVNESIAHRFEPNSPSPKERLQFLSELKRQGFFVGMNCMPLLPKITDTDESIAELVHSAKENNIDYILASSLTLFGNQPADSKTLVHKIVERYYPEQIRRYQTTFAKKCYVSALYQKELDRRIKAKCSQFGVKYGIL